ncbi:hypothetical protein DL766_000993 [Monosporascus sp. MC13-8B]|uniref:Autophagy-related protein 27 n=1 Tax=Monosporascus cannonballus TaxID=155416 RepID=A0ABY0H843_9PEZI|nr:hypothetical protein DL762_005908 [Monosporascus cannonballus]RYO92687.1 hypothetical protein DL763_004600 [Monosporascus cannonballus]RYP38415.1 hypothetical protein DL766_000993 [Monosporascus sp. MC13-8B]
MSLFAGASFGASLGGFQAPEHGAVARHHVAARQNGNSTDSTIEMFIDSNYPSDEGASYAVSVVNACIDMTVLALQCTAGPPDLGDKVCGSNAPVLTVTHAPEMYSFMTVTEARANGADVTMTLRESCAVARPTAATCSANFDVTAAGTQTSSSAVTAITGSAFSDKIYQVRITGGAEKLASPTGTCENAAPTLSVRNIAWCLAGALGIAGFLAV